MARVPHLTTAEFEILKVLWRLEQATVAEVRGEQTRRGSSPAYTTVMTLLGRLAAKGAVLLGQLFFKALMRGFAEYVESEVKR